MVKKILFLDHDPFFTGSTVSMIIIIKKLQQKGFEIAVHTPKKGEYRERLRTVVKEVYDFNSKFISTLALDTHYSVTEGLSGLALKELILINRIKYFAGVKEFISVIKRFKPDLVYINEHSLIQGCRASFLCSVPSIVHFRSCFPTDPDSFWNKLIIDNLKKFQPPVLVISEIEKSIIEKFLSEPGNIEIVYEFLEEQSDIPKIAPQDIHGLPSHRNDTKIVLSLAGILPIKGSKIFLEAAEIISKERSDIIFLLGGKHFFAEKHKYAVYAEECKNIISVLQKRKAVIVLNEISEIRKYLSISDMLVVSSIQSHFSRPVLEAWELNKPVIASDLEHHRIMIEEGFSGLFYRNEDSKMLADKIKLLADAPHLRRELGENGNFVLKTKFGFSNTLGKIIDKCRELTS